MAFYVLLYTELFCQKQLMLYYMRKEIYSIEVHGLNILYL